MKSMAHFRTMVLAGMITIVLPSPLYSQPFKFDFGSGAVADGYTKVTTETRFSTALGYGIDSGNVSSVDRETDDALRSDYLTTTNELFFSVVVPQGNYDVTVILGDAAEGSTTTLTAENRRLLFDRVRTNPGTFARKTITVRRMETMSIDGSVTMSIKDRELGYFTWDKVLTLRFSGKKPAVCGVEITKNDNAVALFLCGNSTVVDQRDAPWCSWGQMIPRFFLPGVAVANYAESGLTSGNFLAMKRLSKLLTEVKEGDYVFVEFGHNDQKSATDVANYPANLKTFRDQILAKKAIPVFVVPTARQTENDPLTSIGGLAQVMRETAQSLGVACIDLNRMVIDIKKVLGTNAKYIYMYTEGDQTHFCEYGGYELARAVMKGLEEIAPSLKNSFVAEYSTFNPENPDPPDFFEQDPPPVSTRRREITSAIDRQDGLQVYGNRLRVSRQWNNSKLVICSLDGKAVGSDNGAIDENGRVTSDRLARFPVGMYILYLDDNGCTSNKVLYLKGFHD